MDPDSRIVRPDSRPVRALARVPLALAICTLLASLAGCSLLDLSVAWFGKGRESGTEHTANLLPTLRPPTNNVQVEIIFVERPVGDPLMGNALWGEIDQIGALDPEVRKQLLKNGFRVGHTGSNPPAALETMLGITAEIADDSAAENKKLVGRRSYLPVGAETEIQTSPYYESCTVNLVADDKPKTLHMQNARCVFRMKASKLQDGWATLEFLPELHHGDPSMRAQASGLAWEYRQTQKVQPLFDQRFTVDLNIGEMAVVSAEPDVVGSVGQHFFIGAEPDGAVQRLLIIRLADLSHNASTYAK